MQLLGWRIVARTIAAVALLSASSTTAGDGPAGPNFPACRDKLWRYIDVHGNEIIAPTFDHAEDFAEGVAHVWTADRNGFIDPRGRWVCDVPFARSDFGWTGKFGEGLARFGTGDTVVGYMNRRGKVVIKPVFDDASDFKEGRARVNVGARSDDVAPGKFGGLWGYIDVQGAWIVKPRYRSATDYSEGFALVTGNDGFVWLDRDGKRTFSPSIETGTIVGGGPFVDGRARVEIRDSGRDRTGFIDRNGTMVISPTLDGAWDFSEGLAAVWLSGRTGFIDTTGKMVIEPRRFDDVGRFSEGLCRVKRDERWLFIDRSGKVKISGGRIAEGEPPAARDVTFNDSEELSNGLARVHVGGEFEITDDGPAHWEGGAWYYMNRDGKIVALCRKDDDAGPDYGDEH